MTALAERALNIFTSCSYGVFRWPPPSGAVAALGAALSAGGGYGAAVSRSRMIARPRSAVETD